LTGSLGASIVGLEVIDMANTRSPNYPAIGLREAVESVGRLYQKERRTAVPADVAAGAMGYKGLSGPSRSRLAALKKYGLIEESKGQVRVSDLAVNILEWSEGDEMYQKCVWEAANEPDLFRELYQTHLHASDDALRAYLVAQKGFSHRGAKQFIQAFRETISFAKLRESDYPSQPLRIDDKSPDQGDHGGKMADTGHIPGREARPDVRLFSWPLSKEVLAEVKLSGRNIAPGHLERLREYLALAKAALETDDGEGEDA
jgi:hypothetical protein